MDHRDVRLRTRSGVVVWSDRQLMTAWWWREQREDEGAAAGQESWVICTSQRPGRNRQCGRVTIDTVSSSGRITRRLRWDGLTFRTQHWVFTER